jgi:protein-export membrane protein SecD
MAASGYGVYALIAHFDTPDLSVVVTLEAQDTPGIQVTSRRVESCVATIQGRLTKLGVPDFEVTTEGDDRIVVALPKGTDSEEVASVLLQGGYLEFYDADRLGEAYASAAEALAAAGVTPEKGLATGTSLVFWPAEEWRSGTDQYYLVRTPPALSGDMVKSAGYDARTSNGSYRITIEFTDEGTEAFAQVTKALADAAVANGVKQRLAIVVDAVVYSAMTVDEEVRGGKTEIAGNFTLREAKDMAAVLQIGTMALALARVE